MRGMTSFWIVLGGMLGMDGLHPFGVNLGLMISLFGKGSPVFTWLLLNLRFPWELWLLSARPLEVGSFLGGESTSKPHNHISILVSIR